MADNLFLGGAIGVGLDRAVKTALDLVRKTRDFEPTLERSRETCDRFEPLMEEMKGANIKLGRPKEEVERLENLVRELRKLVNKYSGSGAHGWKYMLRPYYRDMLMRSGKNLARYLTEDLQLQMARDTKEILLNLKENKLPLTGLSGPPEKPEFTVGFDEPFKKLKLELLKDDEGPSILMLTGLEGSGKTTLAKMLCWDNQIRGKFARNILFVTVSETPKLENIVQILFEHYGCDRVLPFDTDNDAIKGLGFLLTQVENGGNPILLVLDGVRNGDLVEKFKFRIPNYKILFTTRIAFPRFRNPCYLKPLLDDDDAVSLFCHFTKTESPNSYMPGEDLVEEIAKSCKGSRFDLQVIGGLLCGQPSEVWQVMKSTLKSSNDLLSCLQNWFDILEDQEKHHFMDLGLFPKGKRICVPALIDMWAELYELDEDGQRAMSIIHNLTNKNLVNVIDTRKIVMDPVYYYNKHFLSHQDVLRELAIHQSSHKPFERRERLIIDLSENNRPEWWAGQIEVGIVSRLLSSFFLIGWTNQKQKQVAARMLSISTDETFTSDWCNMQPYEVEVLFLNIRSGKYSLPAFIDKMSKLKVLIVINHGFHLSELENFELLGSLPNLKRIRLENVSIPPLCKLKSLQKLSIYMCNTRHAFASNSLKISDALPKLKELNIDYCNDMVELPSDICEITTLEKLRITNCHKLPALPQDIGKLENLEVLMLSSCTDLEELPESVVKLANLRFLDISDCVSLTKLPQDIGNLRNLINLYTTSCASFDLPASVANLQNLKVITCDEETKASWEAFQPMLPNMKIEVPRVDVNLNWLH